MEVKFVFYFFILVIPSCRSKDTVNNSVIETLTNVGSHIKTECACFLKLFANATQHFNWCLVKHAKPVRICEKCVADYYQLLQMNPVNFNDSRCVFDLIKSERFQVVMKVYDFQTGLWDDANCAKCYESRWNFSKHTKDFFQKLHEVTACFENHTKINPNGTQTSRSLCDACKDYYFKLRRIYSLILKETTHYQDESELCVDVMSLMNNTRKDWTAFNCNHVKETNYIVLSLSGMFGFLTFVYYVGMRQHEKYSIQIDSQSRRQKYTVNYDSE